MNFSVKNMFRAGEVLSVKGVQQTLLTLNRLDGYFENFLLEFSSEILRFINFKEDDFFVSGDFVIGPGKERTY